MTLLRRTARGAFAAVQPIWTLANELALNIRTAEPAFVRHSSVRGEPCATAKHADNHIYTSPDYIYVRKIIRLAEPKPTDVLFDLGSGMGRIVCVAARLPFRKCVGVEILPHLCDISRRNAKALRGRRAPIEIICGDCASVDMTEGTMYFMFNPFGVNTLCDTLTHIHRSLTTNPRSVKIIYYNSFHEDVLTESGWLVKYRAFTTLSGLPVTYWRNHF